MALQLPGLSPLKIAAVALAVIGGVVAMSSFSRSAKLEQQLKLRQREMQGLRSENEELQQRMAVMESERRTLESRINDLRGQLTAEGGELGQLRGSIGDLQERTDRLEREKGELEVEVSRLTRERDETRRQLEKAVQSKKNLERAASRLRERFAMLDRDYQRLIRRIAEIQQAHAVQAAQVSISSWSDAPASQAEPRQPSAQTLGAPASGYAAGEAGSASAMQAVELPPIVVGKDQAAIASPVRGRIIDVNVPNRFVVVDKGANDGVHVGMRFTLTRGGETVAQGVVVRVRPRLAACDIVGSRSVGSPQVGDLAVQFAP